MSHVQVRQVMHFAVYRSMRIGARVIPVRAQGNPDSLCGRSSPREKRGVEDFESAVRHLGVPTNDPPLCERCLFLYRVAIANGIPLRHQRLDQVLKELLEKQSA